MNSDYQLTFREIANILGVSVTTVRRQYRSAIRKLRKEFAKNNITPEEFRKYLHGIRASNTDDV